MTWSSFPIREKSHFLFLKHESVLQSWIWFFWMADDVLNGNIYQQTHKIRRKRKSTCCFSKMLKYSKDMIEMSETLFFCSFLWQQFAVIHIFSKKDKNVSFWFTKGFGMNFCPACWMFFHHRHDLLSLCFLSWSCFSSLEPKQVIGICCR